MKEIDAAVVSILLVSAVLDVVAVVVAAVGIETLTVIE